MLFLIFFCFQFFYAADTLTSYQTLLDHKESSNFFHKYLFIQKNNPGAALFDFSGDKIYSISSCDFKYINNKWQGVVSYKQKNGSKCINFFVAQENPNFQDHEFILSCDCDDDNKIVCGYCIKFQSFFDRKKVQYLGHNVALYKNKKKQKVLLYYDSSNILQKNNWNVSFIDIKNVTSGINNSKIVFQDISNQELVYDLVNEKISAFIIDDRSIVCKDNAFYCGDYSLIEVLNSNEIYFKQYHVKGDVKQKLLFNNINKQLTSVDRQSDGSIQLKFDSFSLFYNTLTEKKVYKDCNGLKALEDLFLEKHGWSESDIKSNLNCAIDTAGNIQVKQKNSTFVAFPLYTSFFKRIIFKKILYSDSDSRVLHLEVDNDERLFCFDSIEKKFYVNPKKITYDPINISWIFNPYNFEPFVPESWLYGKWLNLKQKCIAAKITVKNYCNRKIDSFMTYILSFLEKNICESNVPAKNKTILLSLLRIAKA